MYTEQEISTFRTSMEDIIIIIMHPEGKVHRTIMEKALRIIKQLQERLETSQKLLTDLGFRKDYEIENIKYQEQIADLCIEIGDLCIEIGEPQQKLADYKEGCEGLKDAVSDLRNERDKFEDMLKIILRNIRGKAVSIHWIKNYIASFIASDGKDTATIKKEEQDILKRRRINPNGSSQKDV